MSHLSVNQLNMKDVQYHCDYLLLGLHAVALAFAEELLSLQPDLELLFVDAEGGHNSEKDSNHERDHDQLRRDARNPLGAGGHALLSNTRYVGEVLPEGVQCHPSKSSGQPQHWTETAEHISFAAPSYHLLETQTGLSSGNAGDRFAVQNIVKVRIRVVVAPNFSRASSFSFLGKKILENNHFIPKRTSRTTLQCDAGLEERANALSLHEFIEDSGEEEQQREDEQTKDDEVVPKQNDFSNSFDEDKKLLERASSRDVFYDSNDVDEDD
ncbi:unnamed protein product, partial [Amoebophrya sp. A25]|eukprot:GSA25T00004900001.1